MEPKRRGGRPNEGRIYQLHVKVNAEERQQLTEYAAETDLSLAQIVRRALISAGVLGGAARQKKMGHT